MRTLAIDCGGTGIKGSVLDEAGQMISERIRYRVPYPMTPTDFFEVLDRIAGASGGFDRATVGMPGIIRHGRVVHTPHYPTIAGPHSPIDPELLARWRGLDVVGELVELWRTPVRVLNDAEVHGAAVIEGRGLELVLTLGTGLGCAIFDDGRPAPKLELSRATVRKGVIYDQWIGSEARRDIGKAKWSRRVRRMIRELRPVFWWDRLYLGGGESKHLRGQLPPDVEKVPNIMGIVGGVRVWELGFGDRADLSLGVAGGVDR